MTVYGQLCSKCGKDWRDPEDTHHETCPDRDLASPAPVLLLPSCEFHDCDFAAMYSLTHPWGGHKVNWCEFHTVNLMMEHGRQPAKSFSDEIRLADLEMNRCAKIVAAGGRDPYDWHFERTSAELREIVFGDKKTPAFVSGVQLR